MTVGEALKQMRLQAGLTQTEMTAGVVSESFYSKIERGAARRKTDRADHGPSVGCPCPLSQRWQGFL